MLTTFVSPDRLHQLALACARPIVAVFTAGLMTGEWLHRTNDQLAALWVHLWLQGSSAVDGPSPAEGDVVAERMAATWATASQFRQEMARRQEIQRRTARRAAMQRLTVAELRRIARDMGQPRAWVRTSRKAELLAVVA
jgi:hypothetical protein